MAKQLTIMNIYLGRLDAKDDIAIENVCGL